MVTEEKNLPKDKFCKAKEREDALFREYKKTKDKKIRDILVEEHLYIAKILSKRFINRGIDYEDIYQVASLGVLYAVERYDPERGVVFATFATPTVLGEIRKYFRDKKNFIRIPRSLYDILYQAEKIKTSTNDEEISEKDLAKMLNISVEELKKAYDAGGMDFIKSLEYEVCADGNLTYYSVIGVEDRGFLMIEDKDFIRYSLNKLDEKELEFIKKRYYDMNTQAEIAVCWGVSQMYVSRFEKDILKKLRNLYFRD